MILLLAICLAQTPDMTSDRRLDAPVSYKTTGEDISKSLAAIGRDGGLMLSASTPYEDIVALRFEKAPLRTVMAQVAKTLKLEWRPVQGGYELYEAPERRKQADAELQNERIERLKAWRKENQDRFKLPRPDFDDLAARLSEEEAVPLPDSNTNWQEYNERAEKMRTLRKDGDPALWFASAVVANLDDGALRRLFDEGSVTFATKPNRLQLALPKGAEKDLKAWGLRNEIYKPAGRLRIRMVSGTEVKTTASVSGDGESAGQEEFFNLSDETLPPNSREPKGTALDQKLDIEGYLGLRWGMPNQRMANEAVMKRIIESITTPEKREPLSAIAGEGLVEIAEETGSNLVALLGDDMINLGSQTALPTNGRMLLAVFCDSVRAVYSEEDGWITIRPAELALARAKQFPRNYFGQVADKTTRGRLLPFYEVARIVSECSDWQLDSRFVRDYLTGAAGRQEFTLLNTWGDTSAMRLWHGLSSVEMDTLQQGNLPIGRLSAKAKALLWRAVSLGGTTRSGKSPFRGVFWNPTSSDLTLLYPNGFPPNEILESYRAVDDCVLAAFNLGIRDIWVSQSIEKFAGFSGPNRADLEHVRLGKSQFLSLAIDRAVWSADFREDTYDYTVPTMPWKDAPEALQKRFENALKNPESPGVIIR